jgi:hypothetical protein
MNNKIQPTYVSFEQAKLLKEKGFDTHVNHYYFKDGEFKEHSLTGTNGYYGEEYEFNLSEFNENWNDKWLTKKSGDRCFGCSEDKGYFETFSAPEQHVVVEWLRVNHGIWVYSYPVTPFLTDDEDYPKVVWVSIICSLNQVNFEKFINSNNGLAVNHYYFPQEAYSSAFDYILNNNLI